METSNNYKFSTIKDNNNCENKNLIGLKKDNDDEYVNLKKLIRSKYILKKILSFLDEKKKLIMIKYNKVFTKFLDITIEQYKKISGRLKINGINGYGKEYDLEKMNLIFKGFYLNGKKNGKGKEYLNDRLKFVGEYFNGKRNGKGLEFNKYERVIFEGEYLDGKKWNGIIYKDKYKFIIKDGKGILRLYHDNGKLKFEGEYINGNKKGKKYCDNGELIFEGEYLNEKKWNGKIKIYSKIEIRDRPIIIHPGTFGFKFRDDIEKKIIEKTKIYNNILKFEGE